MKKLWIGIIIGVVGGVGWWMWRSAGTSSQIVVESPQEEMAIESVQNTVAEENPQTETTKNEAKPDAVSQEADSLPADKKPEIEDREEVQKQPVVKDDSKTEATEPSKAKFSIKNRLVGFGHGSPSKPRTIDTIILHSSYDASGSDPYDIDGIIAQWKEYDVAPHYLVGRDGGVYRLVKDEDIAWHAGVSKTPDGRTNVNDFSIGIEVATTKTEGPSDAQYVAIKKLVASLKDTYKIKYVLGHDDIAPGRKDDPWHFDWKRL